MIQVEFFQSDGFADTGEPHRVFGPFESVSIHVGTITDQDGHTIAFYSTDEVWMLNDGSEFSDVSIQTAPVQWPYRPAVS